MNRTRALFLPLLLSLALAGASVPSLVSADAREHEEPDVTLKASPRVSMAPFGRLKSIMLTAEIVGPEVEEYYCPEVVWHWPNGARSMEESDCDPFVSRTTYPRVFVRRVGSASRSREYKVCVELRKAGKRLDKDCTTYRVR